MSSSDNSPLSRSLLARKRRHECGELSRLSSRWDPLQVEQILWHPVFKRFLERVTFAKNSGMYLISKREMPIMEISRRFCLVEMTDDEIMVSRGTCAQL